MPSTSIPGEPTGIPGTARPLACGRCERSRLMADAGTWPSIRYPSISPVWHDARSRGTPRQTLVRFNAASSITSATKPEARRWSTQPPQQPQFGSLVTTILGNVDCASAVELARAEVATSPARIVRRSGLRVIIMAFLHVERSLAASWLYQLRRNTYLASAAAARR